MIEESEDWIASVLIGRSRGREVTKKRCQVNE